MLNEALSLVCSKLEHMKKEDHFQVLRKIQKRPESSQRELAKELGFSLGKLNYCLKALQKKGLVKLTNFQRKKIKSSIFSMWLLLKVLLTEQSSQ